MAREVAHVLSLPLVEMSRYEADGTATVIGQFGASRRVRSKPAQPWRLAAGKLADAGFKDR